MQSFSIKPKQEFIPADQWVPFFESYLKQGKQLQIAPTGDSMYPFLLNGRDQVVLSLPTRACKRGDICLFRRENGLYIVHRVHHRNQKGIYMVGDHQVSLEGPLKEEQIVAVAVAIVRKGHRIDVNNKQYLFLVQVWFLLRPLRPAIITIWRLIRKLI